MDEHPLTSLATALLDGSPIDWDGEERRALPEHLPAIRQLRLIAAVDTLARDDRLEGAPLLVDAKPDGHAAAGQVGKTWGGLDLLDRVSTGPGGTVYRAWDPHLCREVALKLRCIADSERDVSAVSEEGRLLARVRHPHVVAVYGADSSEGFVGIWTEFVRGCTLAEEMEVQGSLPAVRVAQIGIDLADALAAVHAAGVVHGDIKAQNVMVDETGRTVLIDFGVGHDRHAADAGIRSGTPLYMAPELFQLTPPTVRSDVYAVGVLLHYLLTSRHPVSGQSVEELKQAHAGATPVRLYGACDSAIAPLARVVDRAASANVEARHASARELAAALTAALEQMQPVPRAAAGGRVVIAGAVIITMAAGVLALRPMTSPRAGADQDAGASVTTGPAAARGAVTSPPFVLVTAFENRTRDPRLDGALEQSLGEALRAGGAVYIVAPERLQDSLRLMKQPLDVRVTRETGLEVCRRDGGIRWMLTGSVERVGGRLRLEAMVIDTARGEPPVAVLNAEAAGVATLVEAARGLAVKIGRELRGRDGQDRGVGEVLERATTTSLEALRFYTLAREAAAREQWESSLVLAREAAAIDPQFAAAHAWAATVLSRLNRREEALAEIVRAKAFQEGISRREQMAVRALEHKLAGRRQEAVDEYEALLRAYPDEYWAVEQLMGLYQGLQYSERLVRLSATAADLRPNAFRANINAAWNHMVLDGNVDAARPYLARARALAPMETEPQDWLRLEPVFDAWYRGDVMAAASMLDAASRTSDSRAEWFLSIAGLEIGLGRLRRAEAALARVPQETTASLRRNLTAKRVQIARARDDRGELTRLAFESLAAARRDGAQGPIWLWVRFGSPDDAERIVSLQSGTGETPAGLWARGEIALARGRIAEAATLLTSAWRRMPPGSVPAMEAAGSAAEALDRGGDLAAAATELEAATAVSGRLYQGVGSTIQGWVQARAQLMRIYRRLSRHDAAERIEAELAALLVAADPDMAIVRELGRR
jgi:hypothetical protein